MARFCVIIPTHRRPALLSRAILSVKAQAASAQVVLVSDASCPDTNRIADTLLGGSDLYIQRRGEPGPAASRNVGIRAAEGEYVIFLDDDDALSPRYLSAVDPLVRPDAVLYTDYISVVERLEHDAPLPVGAERRSLAGIAADEVHVKNFIPPACLVYPMAAVQGRSVEPSLVLNEDWDFILNVCTGFPLRHAPIDGPIVYTRQVADNRGRRNDHLLPDTYRRIYARWPAPTRALKEARQAFFRSVGLEVALGEV